MTDETELAIAGMTSLHGSPTWDSNVALIAQPIGMICMMLLKATNSEEV
jgi:hypothetical protein